MAPPYELKTLDDYYQYYIINCTDPRVEHLPLLGGHPWPTLIILFLYIAFVLGAPSYMKNRPPLNLKNLLIFYNFALIALSGYMCYEFLLVSWLSSYSYTCQPFDDSFSTDRLSLRMLNVNYLFFLSKIIELLDTVIFIVRKKNNQVTFLHVYHHFGMVINWWLAAKYTGVGQCFFVGMVNSFIHTIMYTYYGLAGLGPHMQKYLWWKRYMTRLQLIQFVLIITHTGYNMFLTDCHYPWLFNYITFAYTWSIFGLFCNFYYQTYIRPRNKAVKSHHANGSAHHGNGLKHNGIAANGTKTTKHETNGIPAHTDSYNLRQREINGNVKH